MHAVSHCNCESRCRCHRPVSVTVIHHPAHHMYMTDDLNDDEDLEENRLSTTNHLSPTARPTDPKSGPATGAPDLSAPITIWRSESPTDKCQEGKVIKNIKKKKEKEKEEEMVDEKANLKKKAKGKLTKKKSPVKSESSPADLSQSVSPKEIVRTSESSPESREGLESEDSYERGKERPSSEDVESSSPKKKEKCSAQAKKNGTKNLQTRKTSKRKSPPMSNPNLS
ncbi:protein PROCA1 isoform X2 [Arvicanthis niloticus]|nr:protein PROCA1 isoform X2 [Arvicanthis niloticus]XP_034361997.1 protein PROCA1 isoform X2 [Arvicanthis niloticus]